ncbi:MAG TPA: RNA methyltransferase [Solirubrobacteraceae bacterium]|nr:RNA methyltransferase [Solirubrobacteraceae bacterium]
MTITSPHNQKLKEIRKLQTRRRNREHSHRFVAEGEDLLSAADAAGWVPVERFAAAGSGLPGIEVDHELLASASGLASGTRTLAVYEERWAPQPRGPLCVYLHGVHDPGNVGTILRSAEAFNASCVAIGPGSADPYSPKAVRASMGAIFSVPVARADATGAGIAELPGTTIALEAGAGEPLHELWRSASPPAKRKATVRGGAPEAAGEGLTLLIGSERDGLPQAIADAADRTAHIPITTHSLNAAMAATVALYEVTTMARAR